MQQQQRNSVLILAALVLAFSWTVYAQTKYKCAKAKPKIGSAPAVLWREPTDIKTRDLYWGPGGREHAPKGTLVFLEENLNGAYPKFEVRDDQGVRWTVKLGIEAKPETAATRLVWAVGYFANEDYYFSELPARGLPELVRGREFVSQGKIRNARLKRHNKGEQEIGDWSWQANPFVGTKELNGLKIMMEIICNTDLKPGNQHVYDIRGVEQRYVAADLGASFGRAGETTFRTKGVLKDFQALPLIRNAGSDYVDFWYFKRVPREHARWIGGWLAQLSDSQIRDAFRAAGFSAEEAAGFSRKVREKINELTSL